MFKQSMLAITILLAVVPLAHAEEPGAGASAPAPLPNDTGGVYSKGTLGFSFPVTLLSNVLSNANLIAEPVPTVNVLYFLSDKAALELIAGINLHHYDQTNNATPPMTNTVTVFGIAAGAGYRMYTHKGKLSSYIEPSAVLTWADTANSAAFALRFGAAFGAEREITDWFTFSGALGGALTLGNKFKDVQLVPTASLAANFYWK